jgi:hypothetical protein
MGQKRKWANIPTGHDSPLNYAISARDQSVIDMVDQAVRHKQVMLAYQAVVPTGQERRPDPAGVSRLAAVDKYVSPLHRLPALAAYPEARLGTGFDHCGTSYP